MATKTKKRPAGKKTAQRAATRPGANKPAHPKAPRGRVARGAAAPSRRTATAGPGAAGGSAAHATQHAVEQFLYHQAEILDAKRWQDYIDLFTVDGVYWMPADPADKHWDGIPSIFAEDKNLMTVRMKRVLHPDAWSQRPLWGTNHVVGNVMIEKAAPNGDVVVRSRFHMMELRRDTVRHFAGSYVHHLAKAGDSYRIKQQRVDMTNAQAAFDYVLQVWV